MNIRIDYPNETTWTYCNKNANKISYTWPVVVYYLPDISNTRYCICWFFQNHRLDSWIIIHIILIDSIILIIINILLTVYIVHFYKIQILCHFLLIINYIFFLLVHFWMLIFLVQFLFFHYIHNLDINFSLKTSIKTSIKIYCYPISIYIYILMN